MSEFKEPYVSDEKHHNQYDPEDGVSVASGQNQLHRELKGRHMQMIAM